MTKKAVTSTTAVKVEDKKATKNEKVDQKIQKVAKETIPQHITKDDPEWDDYIVGLKKNVEDSIEAGLFNWYLAFVGFIDDPEVGYADLYDGEKMFRILVSNGYCPECANNYIQEFKNSVNDKGQKKNYLIITREERDFWWMEDDYNERIQSTEIKHMK